MSDQNKKSKDRKWNAWKRYGVIAMASVFLAGTAAGAGAGADIAYAQEEQRITMKTADEEEEERITLKTAEEEETEKSDKKEKDKKSDKKDDADEKSDKKSDKKEDDKKSDKEDEKSDKKDDDEKSDKKDEKSDKKDDDKKSDKEDKKDDEESYAKMESVETGEGSVVATDVSEVVEKVQSSIVLIRNTVEQESGEDAYAQEGGYMLDPYGSLNMEGYLPQDTVPDVTELTSGIVIVQNEEELLIATNSSIAADAVDLEVWFAADKDEKDAKGIPAKIKGVDNSDALAVVAVSLADIPEDVYEQIRIASLGESEDLKTGQPVLAIGHEPDYGCNVTTGIVSALDRSFESGDVDTDTFLIDAPMRYSSIGGAVLNTQGEVIGISVAYEDGGMGYAVPIDTAIPVLERLANKETRDKMENTQRGYLGATVVNVNEDAKDLYDMPEGAFVYEVAEGSAADKAGIRKGDIITRFDGEAVTSSDDLIDKISYYAVGETVTVELQTANNGSYESREAEVTLQEGEESAAQEKSEAQESEPQEDETELDAQMQEERREELPSMPEGFRRFPYYYFNHHEGF